MKQFFKMMFASALGVFVALGLLFFVLFFAMIGIVSGIGSSTVYVPRQHTVFKIDLGGTLADNTVDNPFSSILGDTENTLSLKTLLEAIETAKHNDHIAGIYIESGSLSTESANLQALRRALIDFKESGKFIVAYSDAYAQGAYYLCSVADKVFLNPLGMLEITGIASDRMFYKGLLDKVGVKMEVFKVGTYKGAVEPYLLDKLSDANREQIQSYTSSIWNTLATGIAENRGLTLDDVNRYADEGLLYADPKMAVERGFIDELKYETEAEAYVKELAGQTDDKLRTASVEKVKNIKSTKKDKADRVAILYAEGEIIDDSSFSYNTDSQITPSLVGELIKLKDDDAVKAVVLRVNSPGGSAYVSEQIWRQVVELRKTKPVVVSMGGVAASGGYYISCAADKIVAESNTLTGSIGVFARIPVFAETLKKVGISTDIVKTNKFADLGDLSRPFRDDERALLQASVERMYDIFLTRCADGRSMTKAEIDSIGQGRVWTGEQARERGLVDEIGGMDKAIEIAAGLAKLSDYSVTHITGSKDIWTDFIEKQLGDMKMYFLKGTLGEDYEYLQMLQTIRSASGVQARLPYDVKPL